ncbi:hypothetical protein BgAZ_200340 [Babesia gibsoni]|uniref:Uncharacterized protein n=1 Tax=Babesia gibsoni TaxID=33632 RepID=A0AAD8LKH8_BABGI|nr:hypothetical protein BgAZ_200340 [Babesia gibsoni]
MMFIILLPFIFATRALGSTLIFGPLIYSRIAHEKDVYSLGSNPVVPADIAEKVKAYQQKSIYPVIENAFYLGFTNQLSMCVMNLKKEYERIDEDVVWPSALPYVKLFISKDYVRSKISMANIHTLKMMEYTQKMLLGYANSNFTEGNADKEIRKKKFANGIAFIEMSEKIGRYRKKRIQELEVEVKRIMGNINTIPTVKATGKVSLLVDYFEGHSIFLAIFAPLVLYGFCSL